MREFFRKEKVLSILAAKNILFAFMEGCMASRQRQWTDYPGVYFVEVSRKGVGGKERVYYVVYRKKGRQVEEKVGHQYKDEMTPLRASRIRGERIEAGYLRSEAHEESAKKYTLDNLWAAYIDVNGEKASSRGDTYRYNNYIAPLFGKKTPQEITTLDIDKLRKDLLKKLSPQTVKHVLEQIKRILNFSVKKNFIVAPSHIHFEMPTVDNQKTEMMSPQQIHAFLGALDQEKDQTGASGVRLALATGMRHGAIAALRWDDLDFTNGFIVLRGEVAKNGKTSKIPMSPPARAILEQIPRTSSPFIFPGKKKGTHRVTFRGIARRAKQSAGLPEDFRCMHGLRHTFASSLASSGKVDLYTLQKLLTHSSLSMTQRYSHLADEALLRAASVMEEIWRDAEKAGDKR